MKTAQHYQREADDYTARHLCRLAGIPPLAGGQPNTAALIKAQAAASQITYQRAREIMFRDTVPAA